MLGGERARRVKLARLPYSVTRAVIANITDSHLRDKVHLLKHDGEAPLFCDHPAETGGILNEQSAI